jgi:integrase
MSVRRRGDKWVVDLYLPNDKRFVKTVGTKKQAEQVHRQIQSEIIEGKWGIRETKNITFTELIKVYLEYAKANKAKSTFYTDKVRIEKHLIPYFANTYIHLLTPQMVDEYKQKRYRDKASSRTINNELMNLSHILKMAIRWKYTDRNVVTGIEKMKVTKNLPRFLNEDEIALILESARESYIYPMIMTALHTGMRKSELLNLQWFDIDFRMQTVTIQSKEDWHTKNYKSRTLQMTPMLYSTLSNHLKLQNALGFECEYVFTYQGKRISDNVDRTLQRIVLNAGLKDVTLHTFRHTFASQLVMAGVPLRDVQELMGHQSFETTLQYAHLSEEHSKKQVLRLPYGRAIEIQVVENKEQVKSA